MSGRLNHEDGTGSVRSVTRALALLMTLSAEGLSLTEAAQRANIPLPTALRLMRTLEGEAFAVRLDDGTFVLGPAAVRLAYEADPEGPLRWTVRETVNRLRDRINETTACFVRRDAERLCLESAESRNAIRWVCRRGSRGPLHLSASGKVLLAYGPTEELLQRVPNVNGTYECAGGRVRTIDDLRREIHDIRAGAVAINDQESSIDIWGFAIPFIVRGVCLGAFGFGLPRERSRNNREDLIKVCSDIVDGVTSDLALNPLTVPPAR